MLPVAVLVAASVRRQQPRISTPNPALDSQVPSDPPPFDLFSDEKPVAFKPLASASIADVVDSDAVADSTSVPSDVLLSIDATITVGDNVDIDALARPVAADTVAPRSALAVGNAVRIHMPGSRNNGASGVIITAATRADDAEPHFAVRLNSGNVREYPARRLMLV